MSADDDSFEYTGTGLEKFLGFLVAVVILAVYLGIVQMILAYFGLNMMTEPTSQEQAIAQILAVYITMFAVLPLLLFAQYRARRYKMARTRWRGLRFGMENGAWGYTLRALGYYFLSMITLGVLTPLATFKLEEYMANRTWYGDGKFEQWGRWQDLYGGFKHVLIGLGIIFGCGILAGITQSLFIGLVGTGVGYIWMLVGIVYYRIYAFNYMTNKKVLDGKVIFSSEARTGEVVKIAIIGTIVMAVVLSVPLGAAAGISFSARDALMTGGGLGAIVASVLLYIAALLIVGGLNLVMVIQPIIAHVVNNIGVNGAEFLSDIQQRSADIGADAEGFADALDVGGAI